MTPPPMTYDFLDHETAGDWLDDCENEPPCTDQQECERYWCGLCLEGEPCTEHKAQAREAAAADAAERGRS